MTLTDEDKQRVFGKYANEIGKREWLQDSVWVEDRMYAFFRGDISKEEILYIANEGATSSDKARYNRDHIIHQVGWKDE